MTGLRRFTQERPVGHTGKGVVYMSLFTLKVCYLGFKSSVTLTSWVLFVLRHLLSVLFRPLVLCRLGGAWWDSGKVSVSDFV